MRTKVTLVLIFLNVALFFFIFKFERHWRTEAASLEARRRVLGPEAADIRSLTVTTASHTGDFGLVRQRDTWLLTAPLDWPANPNAVSSILQQLQLLEHETSFPTRDLAKSGLSLADYGLDKPKLTVAFTSGDPAATNGPLPPTILRLGDTTKDGNRIYVLSPDGERIHVVDRPRIDSLTLPLDQLRADAVFTIPVFEARSLSVQTAATGADATRGAAATGVPVRIRYDGAHWNFETPISALASRTAVEITINRLNALRAKAFSPTPPPATPPAAAPVLQIALVGRNRHETLFLGDPVAASDGKTAAGPVEYYAQLEGRGALFTVVVAPALIDTLRTATEKLRETHILEFDPHAVTAITLAAPIRPDQPPLTLQRLETTATTAEGGAWQIVRRGESNQGLQTTSADRAAVQRLLDQLAQLTVRPVGGFISDNPSSAELESWGFNRPEREVTLTVGRSATAALGAGAASAATASSGAGAPAPSPANETPGSANTSIVLRLGTGAAGKVFARVVTATDPGLSIYAVDTDIRRAFPVEPLAWRDRALPLVPANARLTAVKLTDLAAHETLVETPLDAAGQPTASVRAPDAVKRVLAQFRALRARNFVSDGFTDRVESGGEERPWKYQLDITIALAGGSGGEQTETKTLFFLERVGGAEQLAGSKELGVVFEMEQALLDPLWELIYGPHDAGVPAPAAEVPPETPNPKTPDAK